MTQTDDARGSKPCYFCGKPLGGSYSYYSSNACHTECITKIDVKASHADLAPTPQDARVTALVEALRFYAKGNWHDHYPGGVIYEDNGVTCLDYGDKARAALAACDKDATP